MSTEQARWLIVTMPDQSRWRVLAADIARHRARYYTDGVMGLDHPAYHQTFSLIVHDSLLNPEVLLQWAKERMEWSDVMDRAFQESPPVVKDVYTAGWKAGRMEVVTW